MGAVFAVFFDFVVFQDAEGFAGEVVAVDVGGVEDVAQLVAIEAVEFGVVGVELGADDGAAGFVPAKGGDREGVGVGGELVGVDRGLVGAMVFGLVGVPLLEDELAELGLGLGVGLAEGELLGGVELEVEVGLGVGGDDGLWGLGLGWVPEVLGEGGEVVGGVGEFEDAGGDVVDVGLGVAIGRDYWELFDDEKA